MNLRAIGTVAGQESRINFRNRWTVLFAAVFGALTLAISYFGLVTEGYAGFQGFERTSASLLSLVLYLVPLVALTMAALSLTGDSGHTELLFSQPVARHEILLGKLLGLLSSLVTAMLFGFGLAGIVIAVQVGGDGLLRFLSFAGIALMLAVAFLAIGSLVAVFGATRSRAFGLALLVWFFLVMFYDLLVIGAGFLLKERTANTLIFVSLFGNPVDVARVAGMISVGDVTALGAAGAALVKFLGAKSACQAVLLFTLAAWTAAPLAIAARILRKRDL